MPVKTPAKTAPRAPAKKPAAKKAAKPAPAKAAPATRKTAPVKAVAAAQKATPAKAVKPAKPVKAAAAPKDKAKKPKLVRDSFTMPAAEYQVLGDLKKACLKAGFAVKKSELLRIGVALMQKADVALLQSTLAALPPLKAGRPKKSGK